MEEEQQRRKIAEEQENERRKQAQKVTSLFCVVLWSVKIQNNSGFGRGG
jgi:hypothetical protein